MTAGERGEQAAALGSAGRGGLDVLFDPRSVAVVGASAHPEKWGYWLASGALDGRERRVVHLVNRRGGELRGVPFLPGLDALPTAPEQVVVAVPAPQVRPVVEQGLAAGARCFTVITSGGAGAGEERALASLVTAGGARLLGPNCMGVVDTTSGLRLSWGDFPAGAVGLVSQSGNLALEIGRLLARAGQGFSRFVSLGNQRDIDAADALDALIAHPPTRVVAAYVEDFRDGRRLARTLTSAHAAGKPVLLLTVGRSEASGRAAASHTGALVSTRATVAAVCRDAGALLLDTAGELVDTAMCLLGTPGLGGAGLGGANLGAADLGGAGPSATGQDPAGLGGAGGPSAADPSAGGLGAADPSAADVQVVCVGAPRAFRPLHVVVVGDSGGQGALAADALAARGLAVPGLPAEAVRAVAAELPPGAACGNPVDLAGAGEADLGSYARVVRALLSTTDADAVVLTGYFGDYATANPAQADRECAIARELAGAAEEFGRRLIVHSMARGTPALAVLQEHAVPVYERIEEAAGALAGAARLHVPAPADPVDPVDPADPAEPELAGAAHAAGDGGYESVRELLASYGLGFPAAEFVTDADAAVAAAHRTGYPLALKAMGLAHKTEAGGVALGVAGEDGLRAAFARMRARTGAARYAVEAMASPPYAVELIVGVRRDPAFGPVAMVGVGGVTAELLADTAVALAPLTPGRARALLLSLRHAPLLTGWRGAPPVHLDAAAAALCAVARAGAAHPELSELEVNPLLVHPGGAIALDAHGVLA
ncbi:acetate--CoA ligase family protein [Streptomyces sp. B-S-A8]|uniref:Acetate--CoA ligase family protein n=1 Tax=Streptomyces solicavernae TaxID=3043614 RepID=A0ABT6RT80_9ACTN|nr:acetate--CoA ligase [Streptomyces sp. B-S-A8]MDI3387633.1 acetate--CoA ligase family protein [Streptomyces sp. B-S-A8]